MMGDNYVQYVSLQFYSLKSQFYWINYFQVQNFMRNQIILRRKILINELKARMGSDHKFSQKH